MFRFHYPKNKVDFSGNASYYAALEDYTATLTADSLKVTYETTKSSAMDRLVDSAVQTRGVRELTLDGNWRLPEPDTRRVDRSRFGLHANLPLLIAPDAVLPVIQSPYADGVKTAVVNGRCGALVGAFVGVVVGGLPGAVTGALWLGGINGASTGLAQAFVTKKSNDERQCIQQVNLLLQLARAQGIDYTFLQEYNKFLEDVRTPFAKNVVHNLIAILMHEFGVQACAGLAANFLQVGQYSD